MIARNPRLTVDNALPHWAPNHAFAQLTNAGSTGLPAVETYLNKIMAQSPAAQRIYCEGFESLGIIHAEFFFERIDDLLDGAGERLVRLWKWHLAEEFEHRTVCYNVPTRSTVGTSAAPAATSGHCGTWGATASVSRLISRPSTAWR